VFLLGTRDRGVLRVLHDLQSDKLCADSGRPEHKRQAEECQAIQRRTVAARQNQMRSRALQNIQRILCGLV
jgi:hypothetical protein